jgi:tetratricopeptide (TPR) repeat protein
MSLPIEQGLPLVRQFIIQGKPEAALEKIEELLATAHHVELHQLRIEVLLKNLATPEKIATSLQWIKDHAHAEIREAVLKKVNFRLETEIDTLHSRLNKLTGDLPLNRLDDLLPLADHYPAIYTLHGLAHYRLIAVRNKHHPDYSDHRLLRLRHSLKIYEPLRTQQPKSFSAERAQDEARAALDTAVRLLPETHTYHAIAIRFLAEWYMLQDDVAMALVYFQRAETLGLSVQSRIDAIASDAADQVFKRLLDQVDQLLLAGDTNKAAYLLQQGELFSGLPAVQIRHGDLALTLNKLDEAEKCYLDALDCLNMNSQDRIEKADPAQLVELSHLLNTPGKPKKPRPPHRDQLELSRDLPATSSHHRALTGLVSIYRIRGEAEKAAGFLRTLLELPGMPEESRERFINLLDENQTMLQEQQAEELRKSAQSYAKAKQWEQALDGYFALSGLSAATTEDTIGQIEALVYSRANIQQLVSSLNELPVDGFEKMSRTLRTELLNYLRDENQWTAIERYKDVLKPAPMWLKNYGEQMTTHLEDEIQAIIDLLADGRYDEADGRLRPLLDTHAERADLRLLLAQAYAGRGHLSQAQAILLSIGDDPAIRGEYLLTLADIDVRRGDFDQARRRLEGLAMDMADNRRYTLLNRIHRKPALKVGYSPTQVAIDSLHRMEARTHYAVFGVRVMSVRAGENLPSPIEECSQLLLMLGQTAQPDLTTHFSWRTIAQDGQISIALLCRVEAASAERAEAGALNLWDSLKHLLPLQNEVFVYEPVPALAELERLLQPFEIGSAVEITRKEITVSSPDGYEIYLVYPFGCSRTNIQRVLKLMAQRREGVLLDIHFTPTTLQAWERDTITQMIEQDRELQKRAAMPDMDEAEKPDMRQSWVSAYYPEFLRQTRSLAFVGMITMAFAGEAEPALSSVAGMELFSTSDFELMGTLSIEQLETVTRNLVEVTTERWNDTAAPRGATRWRHLLTTSEMLCATRLPIPDANGLPGMDSLKLRITAMPGRFLPGVVIGESAFPVNGRSQPVTAGMKDRLRHTYIVGRTGAGKTTLLENVILQDIEAGMGVCVIDPHGDLITNILERIPAQRSGEVVVFDPSDREYPIGLNILDVEGEFEQNMVISDFLGLIQKLFDPNSMGYVGARFENIVRHTMLAVMEVLHDPTLIDVVRMLSDSDFREAVVEKVRDPLVLNYWTNIGKYLEDFGWGSAKGEMTDWLTSKFGRFVDDQMTRHIIGQSKNSLDFEAIMNSGGILLIDLSKGKIGMQNSQFLGALLASRLLIATYRRAKLRPEERRPFAVFIDEFQNFTTTAFADMLSEARKFGVALTMANQFTSQLETPMREAVFGNVGSILAFQVGVRDAGLLEPEMYPATMDDLINLPSYHLLAKMLIDNQVTPPFPVRTLADYRPPNPSLAETIRRKSRLQYGRELVVVKSEIEGRFKRKP